MVIFQKNLNFNIKSILSHRVVSEKQKSQSSLFVMSLLFLVMLCGRCKVCISRMILSILGYFRPKFKVFEHFRLLISIILHYILFVVVGNDVQLHLQSNKASKYIVVSMATQQKVYFCAQNSLKSEGNNENFGFQLPLPWKP